MEQFVGLPGLLIGIVITIIGIVLTKAGKWPMGIPTILFGLTGIGYVVVNLFDRFFGSNG